MPRGRRLGRPTRPDHRSSSTWRIGGLSRPLPHQPRDTWGFRGRAWAPPRRRGFLLFRSANFPRRCLAGGGAAPEEEWTASDRRPRRPRPPRCWGQEAPGEGQPDILGGRDPRPSVLAEAESLQTQLWSSAATAAGKTCPCSPFSPPPLPCSPFTTQAPPVPARPSCHVGPRRPQGP